jgi:hypothetical protein
MAAGHRADRAGLAWGSLLNRQRVVARLVHALCARTRWQAGEAVEEVFRSQSRLALVSRWSINLRESRCIAESSSSDSNPCVSGGLKRFSGAWIADAEDSSVLDAEVGAPPLNR